MAAHLGETRELLPFEKAVAAYERGLQLDYEERLERLSSLKELSSRFNKQDAPPPRVKSARTVPAGPLQRGSLQPEAKTAATTPGSATGSS
ncbi:MAG: hypothetical protein BGO98_42305 [Myxococcales bacterium 68-20]|nr:MAG: hypothetical protein BGO98_42305 [Myxococcales bacterium 68-20]